MGEKNKINIHLFDNWYIGTGPRDFRIYKKTVSKETGEEHTKVVGYYTSLISLVDNLPKEILLDKSTATSFAELKEDLNTIYTLMDDVKKQLKGA